MKRGTEGIMKFDLTFDVTLLEHSFFSVCIVLLLAIELGFFFSSVRTFAANHNPLGAHLINYGTIPGVMHHELSHALLAFLTGAKVTEVKLFQFSHKNGALGYVSYAARGNFVFKAIQKVFASIAPILCGFISCSLLWIFVRPMTVGNTLWTVLFYYLFGCIILHMSLSKQDLKVMRSGIIVVFLLMTVIFYFTKLDLVAMISGWM